MYIEKTKQTGFMGGGKVCGPAALGLISLKWLKLQAKMGKLNHFQFHTGQLKKSLYIHINSNLLLQYFVW